MSREPDSRPRSSLFNLAMGRALQRAGTEEGEPETVAEGRRMEADATAAIQAGFADIAEHKKQQERRRRARNMPRA